MTDRERLLKEAEEHKKKENEPKFQVLIEDATMAAFGFDNAAEVSVNQNK